MPHCTLTLAVVLELEGWEVVVVSSETEQNKTSLKIHDMKYGFLHIHTCSYSTLFLLLKVFVLKF